MIAIPMLAMTVWEIHPSTRHRGHGRLILTWNSGHSGDRTLGIEYATELIDSFSTRDESWKILFGDTYLLSAGSPPLAIAIRDNEIQPTPTVAAPDSIAQPKPLLIAAIFAALVAFLLNRLRLLRVKRRDEDDARHSMQLSMAHIAGQLDLEGNDTASRGRRDDEMT